MSNDTPMASALMNTYGPRVAKLVKGEGCYLWDDAGNQYLDALSGIAVCGLGHSHPGVTRAICEQAATLMHTSNLFAIGPQEQLAARLRDLSGMDKVFFSNSGAEANEAAIKIARKYGQDKGIYDPTIITMAGSFHGRTMATLTATGNKKIKHGFEPLVSGFAHAPYNDVATVTNMVASNPNIVAVMVEPVQGEGGIQVPADDYLNQLRALCDRHELLLILDEIQSGNARSGKYFCHQWNGIAADVVTTAKGLGNGVPIGACLAKGRAAEVFAPGNHGSTFGGNPLCTHTALTVVNHLVDDGHMANAQQLGDYMLAAFQETLGSCDKVNAIRGKGLLLGIELSENNAPVVAAAKEQGVIINLTAGNVIRILPPLITNQQQADVIIDTVTRVVKAL